MIRRLKSTFVIMLRDINSRAITRLFNKKLMHRRFRGNNSSVELVLELNK